MILRNFTPLRYTAHTSHIPLHPPSLLFRASITFRSSQHSNASISDPPSASNSIVVSLAHPRDPSNLPISPTDGSSSSSSSSSVLPPSDLGSDLSSAGAPLPSSLPPQDAAPPPPPSNLPAPHVSPAIVTNPTYSSPPFHTYKFFSELEKTFPTPTARHLMRATRALLVDRVGKVKRDALTVKDLESVRTFSVAHSFNSIIRRYSKHISSELPCLNCAPRRPC